jgi:hypothetical protein
VIPAHVPEALVTGYEFGGITTWNLGVRFAF